jgi:hypothetical protein
MKQRDIIGREVVDEICQKVRDRLILEMKYFTEDRGKCTGASLTWSHHYTWHFLTVMRLLKSPLQAEEHEKNNVWRSFLSKQYLRLGR